MPINDHDTYLSELLADLPVYAPDERQEGFFKAIDQVREQFVEVVPISMRGFPASCVDMGYIKSKMTQAARDHMPVHGPFCVVQLLTAILYSAVQRLKMATVYPDGARLAFEVLFMTQDDHGHYEYRFAVPFPDGV